MGIELSRIEPLMGPAAYKTYGFSRPLATHWRHATCEEVDCPNYLNGWVSDLDESTADGQMYAAMIRNDHSRSRKEERMDGFTRFRFAAGTPCFKVSEHRTPLLRPPLFYSRGGDWRGNPTGQPTRVHRSAENWVEEFGEHQDNLKSLVDRG